MSKERRLGRGIDGLLGRVAAAQPDYESTSGPYSTGEPRAPREDGAEESGGVATLALYEGAFGDVAEASDKTSSSVAGDIDAAIGEMVKGRPVLDVPIDQIDRNPFQPRLDFDSEELTRLAENIAHHGMLSPVALRQKGDRFELIAGERRVRAAKQAGWTTVPASLLVVDDREMAELALTENIHRKDLNAIEKAIAFKNYLDLYGGTQVDLARRLDMERSTVVNFLRLLDLPEELQMAVRKNELSQGHARALLPLEEAEQFEVAARITADGWSVRQTEGYVQELLANEERETDGAPANPKQAERRQSAHLLDLQQQFRSLFGTKVRLTANDRGKGKLVIPFGSTAEFERIFELILPRMKRDDS